MVEVEPIALTLRNDTIISSFLILCFVVATLAIGQTKGYLIREIKSFPYPRNYSNFFCSALEMNYKLVLCLQTIIMLALLLYIEFGKQTFWTYLGYSAGYMLLRFLLYMLANWTFFKDKDNENWMHTLMFITTLEGILFFFVALLGVYTNCPPSYVFIIFLIVVAFIKFLTLFKCWTIFFYRFSGFFHFILYLCALEVTPLLLLYGLSR